MNSNSNLAEVAANFDLQQNKPTLDTATEQSINQSINQSSNNQTIKFISNDIHQAYSHYCLEQSTCQMPKLSWTDC